MLRITTLGASWQIVTHAVDSVVTELSAAHPPINKFTLAGNITYYCNQSNTLQVSGGDLDVSFNTSIWINVPVRYASATRFIRELMANKTCAGLPTFLITTRVLHMRSCSRPAHACWGIPLLLYVYIVNHIV